LVARALTAPMSWHWWLTHAVGAWLLLNMAIFAWLLLVKRPPPDG
jgi:hypothetical protein